MSEEQDWWRNFYMPGSQMVPMWMPLIGLYTASIERQIPGSIEEVWEQLISIAKSTIMRKYSNGDEYFQSLQSIDGAVFYALSVFQYIDINGYRWNVERIRAASLDEGEQWIDSEERGLDDSNLIMLPEAPMRAIRQRYRVLRKMGRINNEGTFWTPQFHFKSEYQEQLENT